MRKGTKRKAAAQKEEPAVAIEEETKNEQQQIDSKKKENNKGTANAVVKRAKRAKASKPEAEPEYFPDQREMEDLWKEVFPVGTEWDELDRLYQYKWNFSNLENAFDEGGELHGKKVYLFGCTEAQLVVYGGEAKVTLIPVVVAIVSPKPPSDKIGINSVQREKEEIIPMKQMKMDWVPYIPLGNRVSKVESLKSQKVFILRCVQRRACLRNLKMERVKQFEYCVPYFYNPLKEEELKQSTVVDIMYPVEPKPVVCEFDWELDEIEV